ncbi:MAG: uroporphyrinogen-III synthase [Acidobacteria bacterium]|nr:uroporphyrinogen-III synthase [Acidobacteriota bacterium]
MSINVIVTRAEPGAAETAGRITEFDLTPIVSPMLRVVETGFDPAEADGVQHLVFTSANGVSAIRSSGLPRTLRAWCVGPSTAAAARAAGFTDVVEGDGNADDLAARILAAKPDGRLLHIANADAAGNLVAVLRAGGYDARFAAPYRTEAVPSLSAQALAVLEAGPALILLHSAKAAAALAASGADIRETRLVAISRAAAEPLAGRARLGCSYALKPNEDYLMLAMLEAGLSIPR